MDIRQLEAFVAVLTAGRVTAAAKLLERSQPVVSRQVQELEQQVGFTVLHRTRPHVTLTEKGRQLYEQVRPVLASLEHLHARVEEIAVGARSVLRIACSYAAGIGLVPQVIAETDRQAALFDTCLHLKNGLPEDVIEALKQGRADIGVTSFPVDYDALCLHWTGQAPCVLALPCTHPLAQQPRIDLATLTDSTIIALPSDARLRHHMATAISRVHPVPSRLRIIETTSTVEILTLVSLNMGVGVVDPFVLHTNLPAGVVVRPITTYVPAMIGVLSDAQRSLRPEAARLITALQHYAEEHVEGFMLGNDSGLPSVGPRPIT